MPRKKFFIWLLCSRSTKEYKIKRYSEELEKLQAEFEAVYVEELNVILDNSKVVLFKQGKEVVKKPQKCLVLIGSKNMSIQDYFILDNLQTAGIECVNKADIYRLTNDKWLSYQKLQQANLPIPKSYLVRFPINKKLIRAQFTFPVILKSTTGLKGREVLKCEDAKQLTRILLLLESVSKPSTNYIVQDFISGNQGNYIRVLTLGKKTLGAFLRRGKFSQNRQNKEATVEQYPLDKQLQVFVSDIIKAFNINLGALDILFGDDGYVVCEVNANPGFNIIEEKLGVNIAGEVAKYLVEGDIKGVDKQ